MPTLLDRMKGMPILDRLRSTRAGSLKTENDAPGVPVPEIAGIGPIISKGLRVEKPQSFPKVEVPKLGIPPSHLPHAAITSVARVKDFDHPTQSSAPAKIPSWARAVGLRRVADLPAPQPLMHVNLPNVGPDRVPGYDQRILGGG